MAIRTSFAVVPDVRWPGGRRFASPWNPVINQVDSVLPADGRRPARRRSVYRLRSPGLSRYVKAQKPPRPCRAPRRQVCTGGPLLGRRPLRLDSAAVATIIKSCRFVVAFETASESSRMARSCLTARPWSFRARMRRVQNRPHPGAPCGCPWCGPKIRGAFL